MAGGRPPLGPEIVDHFEGSEEGKRRLRAVLEVISGRKTVEEACAALGIERARFYVLERQALSAGIEALTPRPAGRRPRPGPTPEATRLRALEDENIELQLDLAGARVREELASAFPRLARRAAERHQKKRPKKGR